MSVDRNGECATGTRWKIGKLPGDAIEDQETELLCQEEAEWESEMVKRCFETFRTSGYLYGGMVTGMWYSVRTVVETYVDEEYVLFIKQ